LATYLPLLFGKNSVIFI